MRGTVLVAAAAPETLSVVRLEDSRGWYDLPILCSVAHPNRLVEEGGGPIKEIIA